MTTSSAQPVEPAKILELTLPSDVENVLLARQAIDGAIRSLGVADQVAVDIKLAVTEACSNVVKYAYDESEGDIALTLEHSDDSVTITVSDRGAWVEPDTTRSPEESGMGIPLMEALARSFLLERDQYGTRVVLEFDPDAPQSSTVKVIDD